MSFLVHGMPYVGLLMGGIATLLTVIAFWTRPERFDRWAQGFLGLAGGFIFLGLVLRGIQLKRFPLSGLYEFELAFVVFIVIAFFFINRYLTSSIFTVGMTLTVFLTTALALATPHSDEPLMPALQSVWLSAHVLTAVFAYGSFAVAFVLSCIYLLRQGVYSPERLASYDLLAYKGNIFGFIFQTLLLVTGAVWAEEAWGSWWSWDPKETWALITWLIYATALHGYRSRSWAGRKAALFSVIGFIIVIFTLLGVTFLLPGLHSYL